MRSEVLFLERMQSARKKWGVGMLIKRQTGMRKRSESLTVWFGWGEKKGRESRVEIELYYTSSHWAVLAAGGTMQEEGRLLLVDTACFWRLQEAVHAVVPPLHKVGNWRRVNLPKVIALEMKEYRNIGRDE